MLSIREASKLLPNGAPLFSGVNLEVSAGEAVAIVGRSGCGKSTLLSILGHLDRFDSGIYEMQGQSVATWSTADIDRTRSERIGFIFQRFALIPHLSVLENVVVPLRHRGGVDETRLKQRGMAALVSVGMDHLSRRLPRKLSGGEQQRVAIARALVHSPQLILADEPTGSLDQSTGSHVIDILRERVTDQGSSLIVVTHDLDVAARMDRILRMEEGTLRSENIRDST